MINSRPLAISIRSILRFAALLAAAAAFAPAGRAQSNYATPYTFTTLAGVPLVPGGKDGTGAAAQFDAPSGVAVDSSGNVYVADQANDTIRKVTPSGVVTTIAGTTGVPGSANGTGTAALFTDPLGVAVDSSGNVYVADQGNELIRKITPGGVVTTLAGTAGVSGSADGTGTAAQFNLPAGIAVDTSGNVYVSDYGNNTIRKITSAGVVTTFVGTLGVAGAEDGTGIAARFNSPVGVAVDASGNLFVADTGNDTIRMVTSAGVVTTLAGVAKSSGSTDGAGTTARFFAPIGVAVDGSGNVYVADEGNGTIRKVTSGGTVSTLAGSAKDYGFADGPGASARFDVPVGICVDTGGNLYVADEVLDTIRKVTPGGTVSTLAGTPGGGYADGTGSAARFYYPTDMAIDGSGNLYVVDNSNCTIREVTPGGVVTTLAGTPGEVGSADGTGASAEFNYPYGIARDSSGNLYVTDQVNQTIRKITPAGVVTTLAGSPGVAGSANGTGSAATFYYPAGIAVDGAGNLYVSEERNFDIRKITPGGVVTTLAGTPGAIGSADGTGAAAGFNVPAGVALDASGNLYVADFGNATIRKITTSGGVVTTIAGSAGNQGSADGTGAAAQFDAPSGVAVDASGNIFVADEKNNEIREITPAGVVTTLAGSPPPIEPVGTPPPLPGYANGTGAAVQFNQPFDVVVDTSGNLFVADAGNNTIRKGSANAAPQVETQPSSQFVRVGASATFTVTASGSSTLSYQWNFNGTAIAGATASSYTIASVQSSNAGTYTVTVTDANGSVTSSGASLTINTGMSTARLVNLSCRAGVGTGGNILIAGFVSGGSGTSGTQPVLVRGTGPALTGFGVTGVLPDPALTLYQSSTVVATNTGWGSNATQITAEDTALGAFALTDTTSKDSALYIANLAPNAYTAQIAGASGDTGVALAEVYDATPAASYSPTSPRLINLSARVQVGTGGNILIAGFVIGGTGTETVLVRASGPALVPFGVAGTLPDPKLVLINQAGATVASNSGWGGSTQISSAAALVGAFAWTSSTSNDSAILITLAPGAYTAQVSGASGDTGIALVEVYEVP